MRIRIKRLTPTAKLPVYATDGSSAADLFADIAEPIILEPGERFLFPTGIAAQVEGSGFGLFVFARSGHGNKHGVTLSNSVGVIDSDYRGEIRVGLSNLSDEPYTVMPGERLAQIALMPVEHAEFFEAEALDESERGAGGFGSTGKQ
ncbi:MAG TPA: dUTP diphosphatase [Oscillospiraceae bacterium]|nr:dUTP diphosphatase [Oscillospiraceae bacterium]HPF56084.1 dUTP diphosphatase [Clostridiales bacterium]HPK36202.1 dUTP diphosphatase [Oscillospiraceae bacterium]HPR75693.1 dUTP diphosphatase [Oscillospiraceae bacterium]